MRGLYLTLLFFFFSANASAALTCSTSFNYSQITGSSPADIVSKLYAYCADSSKNCASFIFYQSGSANPINTEFTFKSGPNGGLNGLPGGCSGACPEGSIYDPAAGSCGQTETERCAALAGTTTTVRLTGNINDANSVIGKSPTSNNFTVRQREFNAGGCSSDVGAATGDKKSVCVFKADGRYICNIQVGYDGSVSATGSASYGDAPDTPVAESTSDTSQECTTPVVDAEGRHLTCYTTAGASQDGSSTCERGDYDMYCHPAKPTPESENKTKEDKITEKTNPDGGKTTTTNTTTTKTYCNTGACTTTTTTNTSVKVTNGSGETVSETSTCKGELCPGPGDGDGEGEGDGDGDFTGPATEAFPNASDAMPKIGNEDDLTYADAATKYMERIQESPIVAAVTNISVPSGGSCNVGSVSLWGGSVSFNHFCTVAPDVLAGLRYVFLAIWAWAALRMLLTA